MSRQAAAVRNDRHALPDDASLKKAEAAVFDSVREALSRARVTRDDALEQVFDRVYGSNGEPAGPATNGEEKAGR